MHLEIPNMEVLSKMDKHYLLEAMVAALYHADDLSCDEATRLIGKSRREFEAMLPHSGVPVFPDSQHDIDIELNA